MFLKYEHLLMRSGACILFIVGLLKIISAFSGVRYLTEVDPVLTFLSNRQLLLAAGIVELLLASAISLKPKSWYARYGLLSICATFIVYRVGRRVLGVRSPCPCLGRASDWLHLRPAQVDYIAYTLLIVLTIMALLSIVSNNKCLRKAEPVKAP